jgi:hypothetical protein
VASENPADHILINRDAESQGDLLGNARTAPTWIPLLHFHNGTNQVGAWSFRTGLGSALRRKERSVFLMD